MGIADKALGIPCKKERGKKGQYKLSAVNGYKIRYVIIKNRKKIEK